MEKEKVAQTIAQNIQRYRKLKGLTQLDLANKLNYSDKTVSKWERAEGVPDIYVLTEIAAFFGLSVNDLLDDRPLVVPINAKQKKHLMITLSAFAGVWVIAVMFYAIAVMLAAPFDPWPAFIIALPVSFTVFIIFSAIWADYRFMVIPVSLLIWSIALIMTLLTSVNSSFLFFIIAVPIQILVLFVFFVIRYRKKEKLLLKNQEEQLTNNQ